jgi:hypothetical protein
MLYYIKYTKDGTECTYETDSYHIACLAMVDFDAYSPVMTTGRGEPTNWGKL